jgi:hypothetical protein
VTPANTSTNQAQYALYCSKHRPHDAVPLVHGSSSKAGAHLADAGVDALTDAQLRVVFDATGMSESSAAKYVAMCRQRQIRVADLHGKSREELAALDFRTHHLTTLLAALQASQQVPPTASPPASSAANPDAMPLESPRRRRKSSSAVQNAASDITSPRRHKHKSSSRRKSTVCAVRFGDEN